MLGVRAMLSQGLLDNHKDGFNLHHPWEKLGKVVLMCNPSTGEAQA